MGGEEGGDETNDSGDQQRTVLFYIEDMQVHYVSRSYIGGACSRTVLSNNKTTSHMWLFKSELITLEVEFLNNTSSISRAQWLCVASGYHTAPS